MHPLTTSQPYFYHKNPLHFVSQILPHNPDLFLPERENTTKREEKGLSGDPLDSLKVAPAVETSSGRLGTVTRSTWSGKATGKTLAKEMARAAEQTELTAPTTKKV